MQHIRAYEELSLAGLFGKGGGGLGPAVRTAAAGGGWSVERTGRSWLMSRRVEGNPELHSVQVLVSPGEDRPDATVYFWSGEIRTKRFKGLVSILKRRSVTIERAGGRHTFRHNPAEDRNVFVRQTRPAGAQTDRWLAGLAGEDWVGLFADLVAELGRNEERHQQNTSRVNRFFMNKASFARALAPLSEMTGPHRLEQSMGHGLTKSLQVLSPVMWFRFPAPGQALMRGSNRHLRVARPLVNIIRCVAIGCRRLLADYPGAEVSVHLQDKAVFVSCQVDDEGALARWRSEGDRFADRFVELDDLSRNVSVEPVRLYSKYQDDIVLMGYRLCFRFQQVVAEVKESHRITQPMKVCEGPPDPESTRALLAAVDACDRLSSSYQRHTFEVLVSDGEILVEARLEVEATWQDTTREEQHQDEGDLDEDAP